jgi:hypothetical protein
MRPYFFYFLRKAGGAPSMIVEPCLDDEDARARALRLLLDRPGRDTVEIWDEDRRLFELGRPEPVAG